MANFRLLHITDLHIAVPPSDNDYGQRTFWESREYIYPSRANGYVLEAVAEFLSRQRNETDLVLISGDVADDGVQRNLDKAFRFIANPATRDWFVEPFEPTLDAGREGGPPFFITPGNHDRFQIPGRRPGGTGFDKTFGSYWQGGLGGVQSALLEKSDSKLALIAADFCLQGLSAIGYLGQGYAYQKVITALVDETIKIKASNPGVGVVWISHFPPLLDVDISLKLLKPERLLNAATENGVRYVVAGHLHRNQINTYSDVEIVCTGTAASNSCKIGDLHGFWIQRLDVDVESTGVVSMDLTKFRYRPVECAFVEQK
jgi:DNA repair exonuclease SbcCD nuclease subunit